MKTITKLTKRTIDAARHTSAGNFTIYRDTELRGFGLRVTEGGAKAFVLDYRAPDGRKRRIAIARVGELTVEKARAAAQSKLHALVAKGEDPLDAKRRARTGDTLDAIAARYVSDLRARAEKGASKGRLSSAANAEWLLTKHVPEALRRRKAESITPEDLRALHHRLSDRPSTADHVRRLLHAVFRFGRAEGLVTSNPAAVVKPFKPDTLKPRRALTLAELAALGSALRDAEPSSPEAVAALRLLALTGMRRSELLGHAAKARRGTREGLRWGDIDLDAGTYTLRAHGGGSGSKGGGVRTLPLGRAAVDLLRSIRPKGASADDPVIRSPRSPHAPLVGLDKDRAAIFAAAGLSDVDAHCLRHTFESFAYAAEPALAGWLTGRAATRDSTLNRYLHLVEPQRLQALADRVADQIARALAGASAKVLEFEART